MPVRKTIKEGKLQYLDFTLTYAADWKPAIKASTAVLTADTTDVVFIVKKTEKDETVVLSRNVSVAGIVWNSPTTGSITVTFDENTLGKAGNYVWELVVELSNGKFITGDDLRGDFIIEKSVGGNP